MWLFLLFIGVPLIEIALFIQVGGVIGLWWTLGVVILTAALGTAMIRTQGSLAMRDIRQSLDKFDDPTEPLANGAMILFAGALLLTPGFFTDFFGFLLLVPAFRKFAFNYMKSRVTHAAFNVSSHTTSGPQKGTMRREGNIIEGDYYEVKTKPTDPDAPSSGWTKH